MILILAVFDFLLLDIFFLLDSTQPLHPFSLHRRFLLVEQRFTIVGDAQHSTFQTFLIGSKPYRHYHHVVNVQQCQSSMFIYSVQSHNAAHEKTHSSPQSRYTHTLYSDINQVLAILLALVVIPRVLGLLLVLVLLVAAAGVVLIQHLGGDTVE
jgi:hypothetical protein